MPQPELKNRIPFQLIDTDDVRKAGEVGDAIFAYYLKYGKIPTSPEQIAGMKIRALTI